MFILSPVRSKQKKERGVSYIVTAFSLPWMSVAKLSKRDFASSAILPSSTFAFRSWVVLTSGVPSLYLVATVDVCDIPTLHIHHTNDLRSISQFLRLEGSCIAL